MNSTDFLEKCWSHYLALEFDFSNQQRYVAFEESNYATYSLELQKQYLAICSEVDVVCKEYCKLLDSLSKPDKIDQYAEIILRSNVGIVRAEISLRKKRPLLLCPWKEWRLKVVDGATQKIVSKYQSPQWWSLYNKVKHQRLDTNPASSGAEPYYKDANLENVMNALAGLFSLEMNFYKDIVLQEKKHTITVPPEESTLFIYNGWGTQFINMGNGIVYEIL